MHVVLNKQELRDALAHKMGELDWSLGDQKRVIDLVMATIQELADPPFGPRPTEPPGGTPHGQA